MPNKPTKANSPQSAGPTKSKKASELEKTRTQLSAATGEQVSVAQPEWWKLMKEGVLVRLHIRRWRAKAQISLADLGLPEPKDDKEREVYDDLMTLGAKRLLPPALIKQLDAIDSGARKWLDGNSYRTYWGDFVPLGKYDEWKIGNTEYEQKYLAVRDQINREWDSIMTQLIDAYAVAARTAYRRLSRLNPKSLLIGPTGIPSGHSTRMTEDAFVDAFMARIQNAIPTREQVYESFGYETELSFIPLPSMLEEDLAKKEQIERERELERAQERVALEAIGDRERMLRRMNEDVVREARQRKQELVEGFMRDLETQSLGAIYDGFVNVLESIQKNEGRLVGRAADQVRNTIESWRAMNLTQNQEVEAQIRRIAGLMSKPSDKRTPQEVRDLLREVATSARANLITLGATPRSARSVGISDKIPTLELRRARRNIQIELPEPEGAQ